MHACRPAADVPANASFTRKRGGPSHPEGNVWLNTRSVASVAVLYSPRFMAATRLAHTVVVLLPVLAAALNLPAHAQPPRLRSMPLHAGPAGDMARLEKVHEDFRVAAESTTSAAAAGTPFSEQELTSAVRSLQLLSPPRTGNTWTALRDLYAGAAHRNYKDWGGTEESAAALGGILGGPEDEAFRSTFGRVLEDGNYDAAATAAAARPEAHKPWVVLVTGLNGIRKTTSVQQPWFKQLLAEALGSQYEGEPEELPGGGDSFFRQLDYMVATLALTEFTGMYARPPSPHLPPPPTVPWLPSPPPFGRLPHQVRAAGGGHLLDGKGLDLREVPHARRDARRAPRALRAARADEHHGRDLGPRRELLQVRRSFVAKALHTASRARAVPPSCASPVCLPPRAPPPCTSRAPRRYLEHLFPDESYRKLVLNFRINDLSFAERSVDARVAQWCTATPCTRYLPLSALLSPRTVCGTGRRAHAARDGRRRRGAAARGGRPDGGGPRQRRRALRERRAGGRAGRLGARVAVHPRRRRG